MDVVKGARGEDVMSRNKCVSEASVCVHACVCVRVPACASSSGK